MSHENYKTTTSRYWCTTCNDYFENLTWYGDQSRCPKCQSTKWLDIKEEAEIGKSYHKGCSVPSDDSPYP